MQFTTHKRRRAPTVIIVSLIDVLLVVLIFLMVTTTFKKEPPPAIKVSLPESKSAKPGANDAKPFLITIGTNSPYFYLGDRPVTLDRLQNEMTAATKKDSQIRVAIRADRWSPVGEVIKVWDAAKAANVASDRVTMITEKPAGK
jgi:biopolymer transport protein ExbD